jgi:hypothetical protein
MRVPEMFGAWLDVVVKSPTIISQYLGPTLMPQACVAISG